MKTLCYHKLLGCTLLFLACLSVNAQQEEQPRKNKNYFGFEIAAPIKQNEAYEENEDEPFFRGAGFYVRAGFGRRLSDWASVGLHSGIEWKFDPDLTAAPVFANLKIAPKLSQDDEVRPTVSFGYGKVFVLNKNHFSGNFLRGNLGLDIAILDANGSRQSGTLSVFFEISYYHFRPEDFENLSTFNVGLGYTFL
ncbi:outer membrane beta-barrel protein [Flavobacterium magnum]|uniref:outer membrane beta-barrel protein n=1 Tax=Flavobacterium magnum TaxID=2162713 RepID=UPI0015E654C3|nr:outer membrane beta-barrel protein [Flavobacterium magnum]